MNRTLLVTGLGALAAVTVMTAPGQADAACSDRKVVGTVAGGVGGALIGNSIKKGGLGAVVGGLGGAYLGHEIAKTGGGCTSYRRAYRPSNSYARASRRSSGGYGGYGVREAPVPVRYVYYDQYGQPISSGPAPVTTTRVANYGDVGGLCRTETRSFYDERGRLVQRPTQVCDR